MRRFYFNKSVIFLGFTFIFLVSDSLAIINFESVKRSIRKRRYIYYTACAAAGFVVVGLVGYKAYSKFYAQLFKNSKDRKVSEGSRKRKQTDTTEAGQINKKGTLQVPRRARGPKGRSMPPVKKRINSALLKVRGVGK